MNSLDIIRYACMALALFGMYVAGYASGHRDGKREGYARGRSITRITTTSSHIDAKEVLDYIAEVDRLKAFRSSK